MFPARASQTFNPYMSYTAPRPSSNGRTLSRPTSGTRPLRSRQGSRQGRADSRNRYNPTRTLRPGERFYDQPVQGMALSGWGEVTAKPFSYEVEAYKMTGAYANPVNIRPAGGYGQKQWSPPPARHTTKCGLVLRDTNTLHTAGSGVMVETVMPNSQSAWKGFKTKDIITHVNGNQTMTVNDFYDKYAASEPLRMRINRDGQRGLRMCY